jgi:hypothetical protein
VCLRFLIEVNDDDDEPAVVCENGDWSGGDGAGGCGGAGAARLE